MDPAELSAAVQATRAAGNRDLTLKHQQVPFLQSQVANLSALPQGTQRALLRLQIRLSRYNDDVDFLRRQYEMTFENLSEYNTQVVKTNLTEGYARVPTCARVLADEIQRIVDELSA